MLFQKIDKPLSGTRWVVSDVHGCAKTLQVLVEGLNLTRQDQLFLLGDYIDRGPNSAEVLDFLINLREQGYQVYAIRGNHEQEFIENYQFFSTLSTRSNLEAIFEMCLENRTEKLLDNTFKVIPRYWHFLTHLPFFLVLEDFYLVHAGFDFASPAPFQNYEEMVWIRNFSKSELAYEQTQNRRIVVGHSIQKISDIRAWVENKNIILSLDNGCFVPLLNEPDARLADFGNLCALNLDDFRLVVQPCLDF